MNKIRCDGVEERGKGAGRAAAAAGWKPRQQQDRSPGSRPRCSPAAPTRVPRPLPPPGTCGGTLGLQILSYLFWRILPHPPVLPKFFRGWGRAMNFSARSPPRRFPDIPQARSRLPQPAAILSFPRHGEKKTTPAASSARVKPGNGAGTVPDGNMNKM